MKASPKLDEHRMYDNMGERRNKRRPQVKELDLYFVKEILQIGVMNFLQNGKC